MREGEKKEREKKKERKEKKKELSGSTATHEGVVTEGAPESSSGTMTGPPTSRRKTATEELAVPRSKPTERGSSGGEEEEEGVHRLNNVGVYIYQGNPSWEFFSYARFV